jgi:exopolysaccharide/PEP-CTERM locus tyrosine autokinase
MSTIEKAAARLVKKPKQTAVGSNNAQQPRLDANGGAQIGSEPAIDADSGKKVDKFEPIFGNQPRGNPPLGDSSGLEAHADSNFDADGEIRTCELNFPWLADNGFLVPGHDNPQQAQEFRRIKRPLLLNLQPKIVADQALPANVIFITSSLPGEGKTFVSLNLALSLAAELDNSVLLIDGDAAKGDLSRWMGIYQEPGLVDLLREGNADGESAVIETNVERLSVMPSGNHANNLDELYASEVMHELVVGLAKRDDSRIILVDGPPLIATTEAAVLAQCMGQIIMIVEAYKTPQSSVEQAASMLEGSQLVSMLLNKSSASSSSSYGYGYAYNSGPLTR